MLLAAVPEIFKGINGASQLAQADKINPVRPQYQIPGAATEALNTARAGAYNTRLPDSNYNIGKSGANANQAVRMAIEAGRTPSEIMAAAAGAQGQEADAIHKLAIDGVMNNNELHGQLINELNNYAGWQAKQNNYDKYAPYSASVNAKAKLIDAGNQNLYSSLKGIGGAAATGITGLPSTSSSNVTVGSINGMNPTTVGQTGNISGMDPSYVGETSANTSPNDVLKGLYSDPTLPTTVNPTPSTMLNANPDNNDLLNMGNTLKQRFPNLFNNL